MIFSVRPASFIKGKIYPPSSKSYSIRAIFIAACGGRSSIYSVSPCDDAKVALRAARYLGTTVTRFKKNGLFFSAAIKQSKKSFQLNLGESGTALRFVLPLAALQNKDSRIEASGTLKNRPNRHLIETLRQMGCDIKGTGEQHTTPIMIRKSELRGGSLSVEATASSQFVSALLIACPLLKDDVRFSIKGKKIVSQDYIQMTLAVLKRAGICIDQRSQRLFFIKARQKYKGLKNFHIPTDYGLAAFWLAAAALMLSDLTMQGFFDPRLMQADGAIMDLLKKIGVRYQASSTTIRIQGPFKIQGGAFCLRNSPDLVPVMSVLALFARTKTRLYGIDHARIKESDRISDLRKELLKVGARIIEKPGELIIYPQANYKRNVLLDPHNDHRLAMAFAVLGLKIGARVKNIKCCAKSYPSFVRDFKKVVKIQ